MQKSPARSALLSVVYGGVVLLLLLLALFARGFSQDVGDARVGGRYTMFPLFPSRSLEELTLSWNGFALRFSRGATPGLRTWESTPDGNEVVFDGDVRLRLSPGNDVGGSLTLAPVPGTGAGATLVIPFTVTGILSDPPAGAALAWSRAGHTYLLSLPSGAHADASTGTLTLPLGAGAASLRIQGITAAAAPARATPARATTQPARIPDESAMPSTSQMQAALTGLADKAYAGWSQTRFSSSAAVWTLPDGSAGFSEDIGVGLLAESIARGTWQKIFPLWSDALARQQQRTPNAQLIYSSCTYVGGVRDFVRILPARAGAQVEQARGLLAQSDNAVLATPGLVPLLLDHGSPELMQAALGFLTGRNVARLDIPGSLGLLEALLGYTEDVSANDAITRAMSDVVTKKILPSVRSTNAGVFLDSGSGASDIRNSIRSGSLLLRAGAALSSPLASAIGRGLLTAAVSLADTNGFLPASLTLASGRISARQGSLAPEAFYQLLPLDRLIPREVPLSRRIGPGTWMWTSARLVAAESTATGIRLVLGYPAGIAHQFVVQGIRPFAQIRLHGIPWHADPTYYKYSDGWAYDAASRTFYVKLTGRTDQEEIDILY